MATLTYFVVLPFFRTADGDLVADEPIEVRAADRARRQAERVARSKGGAAAFSRTGDPSTGEYDDAVILGRFGEVGRTLPSSLVLELARAHGTQLACWPYVEGPGSHLRKIAPMRIRCLAAMPMLLALMSLSGPAAASVLVTVNKTTQRMTVSVDGKPQYSWPVSTGMRGHATPVGSFRPFRMEVEHYSEEWDDAPMPHSIFFTVAGHAIHGSNATRHLGSPASHGCIRISPSNATKLFALVKAEGMGNTKVVVTGGEPARMAKRARPSRPQARPGSRPDYDRGYDPPDFDYVTGSTSSSVW